MYHQWMKVIVCILLLLCLPCAGMAAEEADIQAPEGLQEGTQLVVGVPNSMSGYFGMMIWADNVTDQAIYTLTHGYSLVAWIEGLGVSIDKTTVSSITETTLDNGNDVLTIELVPGLLYSDGNLITARDYVFSILLQSSPEIRALGAGASRYDYLEGYDAYTHGTNSIFSGVRLLSDTSFSMEVKASYLPYFYGMAMIDTHPAPIDPIAPGYEVRDDGQGAYIALSKDAEVAEGTPAVGFSEEMLRRTLLDPEEGYVVAPRISNGPYQIEEMDLQRQRVTLVVNPNYVGNYEGKKPHIERLVVQVVTEGGEAVDMLVNGEVDLLSKVMDKQTVEKGQALTTQDAGWNTTSYPRSGFAFLAFSCELSPTSSLAVRQAVAMCLDTPALVQDAVGAHAQPVYGYYGAGQWMPNYVIEEEGAHLVMAEELAKLEIPQNLAGAIELLEGDGWTLNELGEPFDNQQDSWRYRQNGDELEPLLLRMGAAKESSVADVLTSEVQQALAAAGIGVELTRMSFPDMIEAAYKTEDRSYHVFFISSNFAYLFDPAYDFRSDDDYLGVINKTQLQDEELERRAWIMRNTQVMDIDTYARQWLAFQQRLMETLPIYPLYTNNYFDFYVEELQDYDIASRYGWADAILYAWLRDAQ